MAEGNWKVHCRKRDFWHLLERGRRVVGWGWFTNALSEEMASELDTESLASDEGLGWQLLEAAPDPTVVVDRRGVIRYVNRQTGEVFGYDPDDLVGEPIEALIPSRLARNHAELRLEYFQDPQPRPMGADLELAARRQDGSEFPVDVSLSPLQTEQGLLVLASIRDVTERRRFEEKLAFQAMHDPLTGLPNRQLLMDRLRQALARQARHRGDVGLLYVDIDHFKWVNDSRGHGAGDSLLVSVGQRLQQVSRDEDTVARVGGDEFIIVFDDVDGEEESFRLAERCARAVSRPVLLGGDEVVVTVSIGIAVSFGGEHHEANELIRRSDSAMYKAKQNGRDRIEIFRGAPESPVVDRLAQELRLRRAIESGEIVSYYQPEIDLSTSQVTTLEALARWRDPERGLVPPSEFIPLAEETGLIIPLGIYVLRAACEGAATHLAVDGEVKIAVNLSARQLLSTRLTDTIAGILESSGISPSSLIVEITESVLLHDLAASSDALHSLKDLGLGIAVDDFGTGYSSLLYLKGLPVDELKIDQTFVSGLEKDPKDRVIVASIIDMAHGLGITTTAEGVEHPGEVDLLRLLGCERAQGYFWTHPLPADELATWIATHD